MEKPTKEELEKKWNKLKSDFDFHVSKEDFDKADEIQDKLLESISKGV